MICREQESFDYCVENCGQAIIYTADDMAFLFDKLQLVGKPSEVQLNFNRYKLLLKRMKRFIRSTLYSFKNLKSSDELNAFRLDCEKTGIKIPINNIDISQVYSLDAMTEEAIQDSVRSMLNFIEGFKRINTNRLHVAILATLLGKQVHLYDN